MNRPVFNLDSLDDLEDFEAVEPLRLSFLGPLRGGPRLTEIRQALQPRGRLRLSATQARIFADLDPGSPEPYRVALDVIARSDAAGLERVVLSALPHVDEISISVDGRSDEETRKVAEAYADIFHVFQADDIGLSDEEWQANKIHFANARNIGRSGLKSPWALFIDTDEYLERDADLRDVVANAKVQMFGIPVVLDRGEMLDYQRLALSGFRWRSATHNQLIVGSAKKASLPETRIVQDLSLRAPSEIERRTTQRNNGIELLAAAVERGDLSALFHLAKHRLGTGDEQGIALAQDYRFRMEVHGPAAEERAWLAFAVAKFYYDQNNLEEANLWAIRALLDRPQLEALCLLGDLAEERGDFATARAWYEAACAVPESGKFKWHYLTDLRWGRLRGLRRALAEGAVEPNGVEEVFTSAEAP